MQPLSLIIILGHKLQRSGECTPVFIERISHGIALAIREPEKHLLITGGKTRKTHPPEADQALAYISGRQPDLVSRTILEREAKATSEHPQLVRDLLETLNITPTALTIVTSAFHLRRTRRVFATHWPGMSEKITFVGVGIPTVADRVKETTLLGVAYLDPYDTWLMPTLKRRFRNGE